MKKQAIKKRTKKIRELQVFLRKIVLICLILSVVEIVLAKSYYLLTIGTTIFFLSLNLGAKKARPQFSFKLANEATDKDNVFYSIMFILMLIIPIWVAFMTFIFIIMSVVISIIAGAYFEGIRLRYVK